MRVGSDSWWAAVIRVEPVWISGTGSNVPPVVSHRNHRTNHWHLGIWTNSFSFELIVEVNSHNSRNRQPLDGVSSPLFSKVIWIACIAIDTQKSYFCIPAWPGCIHQTELK